MDEAVERERVPSDPTPKVKRALVYQDNLRQSQLLFETPGLGDIHVTVQTGDKKAPTRFVLSHEQVKKLRQWLTRVIAQHKEEQSNV